MNGIEKFAAMTSAEKIKVLEDKILGQFDASYQAFDLEEIASLYDSANDRLLVWNAAANLVQQGRAHVIQVREKDNEENTRWIMVGFDYGILSNKKFHPPGQIVMNDNQKATKVVEFKKTWKNSLLMSDVAKTLNMPVESVKEQVMFYRQKGFNFPEKPDEQVVVVEQDSEFITPVVEKSDEVFVTPECITETMTTLPNSQAVEVK